MRCRRSASRSRLSGVPPGWTVTLLGGGQPVARRDGGDQRQHRAAAASRRAGERRDGHHAEPHRHRQGPEHRGHPAGRGHARQGSAGQAHHQAAAAVAARHLEVELRVPAQGQERQRPQSRGRLGGAGAAEFRDELHRAVRQPGADLDPGRGRPVQDRQAQGPAAEHDRRQPLSGFGEGLRRGRLRRRQRSRSRSPASRSFSIAGRDGVLSGRAEAGKEASIPIVVTNTGTAPADEIELTSSAPSGWKIAFEPKTHRPHRAGTRTRKSRRW